MAMSSPLSAPTPRRLKPLLSRLRRAVVTARRAEPLEFEQLLIRYLIGLFTTSCAIISFHLDALDPWQIDALAIFIPVAWLIAAGFMVHYVIWPMRPVERRGMTILFDASTLSLFIYFGGEQASIFFPVYLWVILGNGFRFGIGYMYASMAANGACFLVMAVYTPHWRADWAFAAGLVISLVLIPLYVSSLIRKLRSAMAEAKAANRAKSDFLATMSHELRTPLNAILGLSHSLNLTTQDAQDRMSAMSINSAAGRLLEMVDTILDFQKVESQAVSLRNEPVDITRLIHDAESLLRPLARRKGLWLHIRFDSALPPRVLGDKDHFKTVLLNLGGNAIKYTDHGHVWIVVSHTGEGELSTLRFEVRDTGSGIPKSEHSRLFERFVQGQKSERSREGGVGLGLSLCRSLVELMSGEIGFSSEPGAGSTFWFEVPAKLDGGETPETQGPQAQTPQIALLVRRQDRDRLVPCLRAHGLDPGATIANPRDFLKARAASSDLGQYVLVIEEVELDSRSISEVRHALANAPIPPAVVVKGPSEKLAELAHARLGGTPRLDSALIKTVAAWHSHKPSAPIAGRQAQPDVAPLSVLVADDHPFNRRVAQKLLSLDGHRVTLADSGEAALDVLMRGGVDLAFLDINMPDGDGVQVCKDYQLSVEPDAQIPIIAMTADVSKPTKENCLRAGMSAVLHKPVQVDELRETIRAHAKTGTVGKGSRTLPGRADEKAEAPVLDSERVEEMISLFGAHAFRDEMAPMFEADFERNLNALHAAVGDAKTAAAHNALHAMKSCANNIGAASLAAICEQHQHDCETPDDRLAAQVRREYHAFKEALYTKLGGPVPENDDDTPSQTGESQSLRQVH